MNDNPDKVVYPSFVTRLDTPSERVVAAIPQDMQSVVIMGYDADGEEYFRSSIADGGSVLWLMERFKLALLKVDADE